MNRILITGGAGFIGSSIVEHFHDTSEVRVLDNLSTGDKRNLRGFAHHFIEGSITERELVRHAMEGVDYVFHLAAMTSVPESMAEPTECVKLNTTGTLVVLEEAARAKVRRLCFSSSAAVYGEGSLVPKVETMPPEPCSPYAITKLDGELYCDLFQREGRLETTCLRYFNVFGPRQTLRSRYAAVVPIFVRQALQDEDITIFGDGEQTRDFIFIEDVVAANVHFATAATRPGVYNVASGRSITINELARNVITLTKSRSNIVYKSKRPGDVKVSVASIAKLRDAGFTPQVDFGEALAATIKSYAPE
jgi:nucleoside-diphosphate-sugar epimerase